MASAHNVELYNFYDRLVSEDPEAIDIFLHQITVGHTYFFRENAHFKILLNDIKKRSIREPLIWCAASSSGEEPYSIAISLLESGIANFKILASDVNLNALKTMNKGLYHISRFENMDPFIKQTYFKRANQYYYSVIPKLRDYLVLKRLNLHDSLAFESMFDYIFCRNVLIYFSEAGRSKVIDTLVRNLLPKGLLFVGHSEAILSLPDKLDKDSPACYRKN
ncbi:chemotaxis protein CheR [Spirochaetota bacterium]